MFKTRKRKIISITVCLAIVIAAGILIYFFAAGDNHYGLNMSGSYLDNSSEFVSAANGTGSTNIDSVTGLSKTYLDNVTYEITKIDKAKMTATVVVSVPDVESTLPALIDQVIADNKGAAYDDLLSKVQAGMDNAFQSAATAKKETTVQLPIKKENGVYKLVASDELESVIFGNLEDMYTATLKTLIGGMTNEAPK